jgi:hypothetical protein
VARRLPTSPQPAIKTEGADIRKLSLKMDKPALAMDERLAMQEKKRRYYFC